VAGEIMSISIALHRHSSNPNRKDYDILINLRVKLQYQTSNCTTILKKSTSRHSVRFLVQGITSNNAVTITTELFATYWKNLKLF